MTTTAAVPKSRPVRAWHIFALALVACLTWNFSAGKDLNWDQINYHYYLPYSMLNGRLAQDFFPASVQSYLNPISYVPFFWMVNAGWHSLLVGSILAAVHAVNLLLLFQISRRCLPADAKWAPVMATIVGALTPLFWVEVGSSFNDITVCIFVLLGVHAGCSIRGSTTPQKAARALALAGVAMGLATGLKLTSASYAVAGAAFCLHTMPQVMARRLAIYTLGGVAGALVADGWWAWQLAREFGNPIFPFYNALFHSPLFDAENITMTRFIPGGIRETLMLIFEFADPVAWVYTETAAPDLRVPVAFLAGLAVAAKLLVTSMRRAPAAGRPVPLAGEELGLGRRLLVFFVIAACLWLLTSANGRYGIPLLLLLGPVTYLAMRKLAAPRWAMLLLAAVGVLQTLHAWPNTQERWTPENWTPTWFEMQVPKAAQVNSSLYLSVGMQSHAFLAPFVHPDSAFVSVIGQTSIEMGSPAGERLRTLLAKYDGRVRVLAGFGGDGTESQRLQILVAKLNHPLQRLGLAASDDDCQVFRSSRRALRVNLLRGKPLDPNYYVVACPVHPILIDPAAEQKRKEAGLIMDAVQEHCSSLLRPRTEAVERVNGGYVRRFIGTEFDLVMTDDGQVFASQVRSPIDVNFGTRADWIQKSPKFECPRRKRSSAWFDGRPSHEDAASWW